MRGLDDVQRTYIVLSPDGTNVYRRLVIGRKRLPDAGEHARFWGYVDAIGVRPEQVKQDLREETHETKTRGERKTPAARAAGEGVYALVCHGNHAHIAYVLELPGEPGDAQNEMNIRKEASYIITVKNPEAGSPPGAGLPGSEKADLSEPEQDKFHGRRFIPADPELLNRDGVEFILIGADETPDEELGIDLHPEDEDRESADIFRDLRLESSEHLVEPLFEGYSE